MKIAYISYDGDLVRERLEALGYGLRDPGKTIAAAAQAAGLLPRTLERILAGGRVVPRIAAKLEAYLGPMPRREWALEGARVVAA